jgi:glycosyltransferase involved in cell wall biosynthesis
MHPKVTILVPNYKTLVLTKLCLRLLRKYTLSNMAHVIVIDNASNDNSLAYLRSLSWIELIERTPIPNEGAISAHSRALDLGFSRVTTPYILSIHTDTLVKHPDWLNFLIAQIEYDETIAGVGSWKLEVKPAWRHGLKHIERMLQLALYQLSGKSRHGIEGVGRNYFYLRSHCAMYRVDLLKQYQLHFSDGDMVAGKFMHKKLLEEGYKMIFLPSDRLIHYVEHINHATTVLNPELSTRASSVHKGIKRIEQSLLRFHADKVLQDESLDY